MQFSHPFASAPHSDHAQEPSDRRAAAYQNLFHEPAFAPSAEPDEQDEPVDFDVAPAPRRRQNSSSRNRRRVA